MGKTSHSAHKSTCGTIWDGGICLRTYSQWPSFITNTLILPCLQMKPQLFLIRASFSSSTFINDDLRLRALIVDAHLSSSLSTMNASLEFAIKAQFFHCLNSSLSTTNASSMSMTKLKLFPICNSSFSSITNAAYSSVIKPQFFHDYLRLIHSRRFSSSTLPASILLFFHFLLWGSYLA